MFLILAAQYERWSLPLAVITAVPFALFGAIVAIYLRGIENDIYFQVGLVTLIGLSAKNAILIVEFAAQRQREGLSVYDAAMDAARLRFRPIIMTSLAFILGVVPLGDFDRRRIREPAFHWHWRHRRHAGRDLPRHPLCAYVFQVGDA